MADNTSTKSNKLAGTNYTTPDLVAKVTGRAKYAEDFKAEGMLYCKFLLSPMPHARVLKIDASAALAMPGVKAILTVDDLPQPTAGASLGEGIVASTLSERGLTMEPMYEGEPILALAAVDEWTAADAIEKIVVDYEPLPFAVDPIASLRPGGANAREQGNVWMRPKAAPAAAAAAGAAAAPNAAGANPRGGAAAGAAAAAAASASQGAEPARGRGAPQGAPARPEVSELKWTAEDFANAGEGLMPQGEHADEWTYGDVDAAFKDSAVVIERTWVGNNTSHQVLEPRSAMAYWQNGKLYLHGGTQSTVQTVPNIARWVGVEAKDVVLIAEYTGGGFGSRIPGYIAMAVPALLSKKANAPVMMRITREEEHYIGRARPALHSYIKAGFAKDGHLLAIDLYNVTENGPFDQVGDGRTAADTISLSYQPKSMRWRGVNVLTNTPPRGAQRAPGGMQGQALFEPILGEAARKLGIDEAEIHRINAPAGKARYGAPNARGQQAYVTSAFVREAIDRGVEIFNWDEKKARSGKRNGSKVRGVGMAVSNYSAGSVGFDGLLIIKPDGRVQLQSGIGNHGTHSVIDVHRVAADILGVPWEQCDVVWGDTSKNLPWTCSSGGSQTTHAMTRAAHAVGNAAVALIQEVAAKAKGGNPAAYKVAGGRVSGPGGSMTLAEVAKKAIDLGGKYDGHEPPDGINNWTKTSMKNLAGQGLVAAARDAYPRDGQTRSFVVGFAEVEVDVETGKYHILDYAVVADVGTVINPRSLRGQAFGGSMLGIGHAISQKWVYDQHYGVPLAKRFHYSRPPTILDAPQHFAYDAVNLPDPETPVGARGIGEPPVGAGCGAVLNAIAAAVGDEVFRRMPVTADIILAALEKGRVAHEPLTANI
ncbi:MAG: xanthine dehydrogenase family protein molybdopterin-binding subunit [Acidobacteriaceae bacterium]|jgi:CO/xanthine dehydrogenase Mo-binding subunit|nr:xanthine dehydrogenase family protein molybdopterin-binding subunit [Acidobacteriaceae bacterium]